MAPLNQGATAQQEEEHQGLLPGAAELRELLVLLRNPATAYFYRAATQRSERRRWLTAVPLAATATLALLLWGGAAHSTLGRGGHYAARAAAAEQKFEPDDEGGASRSTQTGAISIFDHVAEEVWEEAAPEAAQTTTLEDAEPPGKLAAGDLEWEVKFDGYVRVRSSPDSTSENNVLGKLGPQGVVLLGEAQDGWLHLLHSPFKEGYILIETQGQVLVKKREVSYMAIPHGNCSQFGGPEAGDRVPAGMSDVSSRYVCAVAAIALGFEEEKAVDVGGRCVVEVAARQNQTVCSSGEYPDWASDWEDNPAEVALETPAPTPAAPAPTPPPTTFERPLPRPLTTVEEPQCDQCCPQVRDRPTLVIPAFERDLCKLKVTARSVVVHDKDRLLGKVIICWTSRHPASDYSDELDDIRDILREHGEVEVLEIVVGDDAQGWVVQQAAKLKIASRVHSEFYVVLDAKNALLKDVTPDTFFTPCNQAKIFGRYDMAEGGNMPPGIHLEWYKHSAEVLNVSLMDAGRWPASITPIVMHRQSVLDLLAKLGEPQEFSPCSGGLCEALARSATEFTLYLVYVGRLIQMECVHDIEERLWGNELAASIWRAEDEKGLQGTAKQIKAIATQSEKDNGRVMFFGAQAGALNGFEDEARFAVLQDLYKVYSDAGLYQFENWDNLAECVVGGFYNGRL